MWIPQEQGFEQRLHSRHAARLLPAAWGKPLWWCGARKSRWAIPSETLLSPHKASPALTSQLERWPICLWHHVAHPSWCSTLSSMRSIRWLQTSLTSLCRFFSFEQILKCGKPCPSFGALPLTNNRRQGSSRIYIIFPYLQICAVHLRIMRCISQHVW